MKGKSTNIYLTKTGNREDSSMTGSRQQYQTDKNK